MAKNSVYDYDPTAANNTDIGGVGIVGTVNTISNLDNAQREMAGHIGAFVNDQGGALTAGGTADALTITSGATITALGNGLFFKFRAASDNTGAATLNLNAIGAKAIRKMDATGDVALAAGDIQATGIYEVAYSEALNGAAGAWLLLNPTLGSPLSLSGLTLTSTDAGATAGPDLTLYRNSASPAASDIIGRVLFQGEDSAGNTEDYAEIYSTISDSTSTSEDATTLVRVKSAGAMTTSGTFTGTGFQGVIGATTPAVATFTTLTVNTNANPDANDGAGLGTSALGWSDLFLAEGAVINWDNGDATISQSGNILSIAGISDFGLEANVSINWGNGDVTLAHSSNALTVSGGNFIAPGTATNDDAAAGIIGEIITGTRATGSALALTSGAATDITSISLTAGDWDVEGAVAYRPTNASTSVTQLISSVSTTSATQDATGTRNNRQTFAAVVPGAVHAFTCPIVSTRLSLAGTTTVYLVGQATFTVSTLAAFGEIRARRVR